MKEAKAKEQLLPQFWLSAAAEEGRVRDGVVKVRPEKVHSNSFWRLICHLDAILEDANRELFRRVTSQPQPEKELQTAHYPTQK